MLHRGEAVSHTHDQRSENVRKEHIASWSRGSSTCRPPRQPNKCCTGRTRPEDAPSLQGANLRSKSDLAQASNTVNKRASRKASLMPPRNPLQSSQKTYGREQVVGWVIFHLRRCARTLDSNKVCGNIAATSQVASRRIAASPQKRTPAVRLPCPQHSS